MSSAESEIPTLLSAPVDNTTDHILGPVSAPITLVEYGSYACSQCRAANERIAEVRTQLGDRLRYVFRHRPLPKTEIARRAAELAECARTPEQFWDAHVTLMTRSAQLTEDDLAVVRSQLQLDSLPPDDLAALEAAARQRVATDRTTAWDSGVRLTPSFYINGRRYDGPWDESSFTDAMLGSLGHRVRSAALVFASWAPSTGLLLLAASLLAVVITNSPLGAAFDQLWHTNFGLLLGERMASMSLLHWVNDGLLTIFFLVVGLEIKREFTIGSLASRRSAALPIAAAVGGMVVPALVYSMFVPAGPWSHGWGVPMATDTAFAVALIAMMGSRVPVDLRIFLTAAAIVDDIGAIIVVAIFYSGSVHAGWLAGAAGIVTLLWLLNRASIYRITPYLILGLALWVCILNGGLHATLAGVLLAAFIPTRAPPNYRTLAIQADAILAAEARMSAEQYRVGPSESALRALDAIHDRIESPADRLLRNVAPRSSYLVLPIFALANAGVVLGSDMFAGNSALMLAIAAGLVVGKPVGFVLASAIAVRIGVAAKPEQYTWRQLAGAGALAGIGFTMSLFIAGQAFPVAEDFAAAKVAVFSASALAAVIGVALLWSASREVELVRHTTGDAHPS